MHTINIACLIGTPNAIIQKFGLKVFEEVSSYLEKGEKVSLSFSGLRNATTGFFHASIGNIYKKFPDTADYLLKMEGLEDMADWDEKVKDAIFLVQNPERAKALDEAISALFD